MLNDAGADKASDKRRQRHTSAEWHYSGRGGGRVRRGEPTTKRRIWYYHLRPFSESLKELRAYRVEG